MSAQDPNLESSAVLLVRSIEHELRERPLALVVAAIVGALAGVALSLAVAL